MEPKRSLELTKQGIAALKKGDKKIAAQLLYQATQLNSSNQIAWLWLAGCMDNPDDTRVCLEKVRAIDATNEAGQRAVKGLQQLADSTVPMGDDGPPSTQQVIEPQPHGLSTDLIPSQQVIEPQPHRQSAGHGSLQAHVSNKKQNHPKKKSNVLIGCLSVFGLFFCCAFFGMLSSDNDETMHVRAPTHTPTPEHSALGAELMCQQFLEDRLKAPATAEYAPVGREGAVEFLGDQTYQVISYVDAQNSFGAMLRIRYLCTVQYVGDDTWNLVDLVTDD